MHLPRVIAAQRISEDAGAIANYAVQIGNLGSASERETVVERAAGRRQAMEESLAVLRASGEDSVVLDSLAAAIDGMMRSVEAMRTLAGERSEAATDVAGNLGALRQAALDGASGGAPDGMPDGMSDGMPDGTAGRAAVLTALVATASTPIVLDRLARALAASPEGGGEGRGLVEARRRELELDTRLRNLGRYQWEKAAELVALASGYAAEARERHDRQSRQVSRLVSRLGTGLAAVLVVTVLGVMWLSRWFGRSVIAPVVELAAATRRIAAGDLDVPIPRPRNTLEVSDLADALVLFRDATREVRDQRDALAWRTVALDAAAEAFIITDRDGVIEYVNPAFTTLTGYGAGEVVGRTPAFLRSGQQGAEFYADMWKTIRRGEIWRGELVNRRRDGTLYAQAMTISPVPGADGRPVRFVAVERDVTDARRLKEELERLATTDPLTGLHNRRHLQRVGTAEVERARRYGLPLSLLILDLDHFKRINDLHGHAAGDHALRAVADTCRGMVRGTDVLARVGGEEFVVLLPQTDTAGAAELAERLRLGVEAVAVSAPTGQPIRFSVSIGVADLADARSTFEAVQEAADQALYRAKRHGRNRVCRADVALTDPASVPPPPHGPSPHGPSYEVAAPGGERHS